MLYKKGERRYTEATPADVLGRAAKILQNLGMAEQGFWLSGVADSEMARELRDMRAIDLVSVASRKKMLSDVEEVKPPRRGVEPA